MTLPVALPTAERGTLAPGWGIQERLPGGGFEHASEATRPAGLRLAL